MKYKFNKQLSAFGKVYEEGKEYPREEIPLQFIDAWIASGDVETIEE